MMVSISSATSLYPSAKSISMMTRRSPSFSWSTATRTANPLLSSFSLYR